MKVPAKNIINNLKHLAKIAAIMVFVSACSSATDKDTQVAVSDSAQVSGSSCDIEISGIRFTRSVNGADTLIEKDASDKVIFRVGEKKDFFADPNGKLSNNTAPILLTRINNKEPFTFTSKVTPQFTETGLYNAGVLYIYVHDKFWQKLCFEQDEQGRHRVVTVRTVGTSDDNNHDIVPQASVYMKISSDGQTLASYYSLDKKTWQLVRLYKNNYPDSIWVGISAQCPVDTGSQTVFDEISLKKGSVKDFRLGN